MENYRAMSFGQAFDLWIASRVSLSAASVADYRKNFKRMQSFFAPLSLGDISIEHINQYRAERQKASGPNRINKELNMLQQIMTKAGLWEPLGRWYERLPQPKSEVGIALSPEEEAHLFLVASQKPRWRVAYLASLLSRNTSAGPGEIRMLTLGNIDTEKFSWIYIAAGLKNRFRRRKIDCNEDARWALRQLYERAQKRGAESPSHYLLPARGPDPAKPQLEWHKAWHSLRKQAAKKFPRLAKVRLYDMRHTIGTRLLENPFIPYNVIEAVLGHRVDSETKRVYDHLRYGAIAEAVAKVGSGHSAVP